MSGDAAPRALYADLDVVLGKALEKDPARRFQTAAELGADLERVLARLPIEARAPTLGYRAARFAERNRALTALSVLALGASVVGVVGLARGLREAHRRQVEVARERDVLDAVNQFVIDDILLASSPDRAGPMATALELLERASAEVDARLPGRPLMAAAVHQALASAFAELDAFEAAERHAARSLALRRENAGADAPDTVRSEIAVASLLARRQDFARAEPALVRALERARTVLGTEDRDLYLVQNDLGVVLLNVGRPREALDLLEGALAGRARLLGPADRDLIMTLSNLALCASELDDAARALELLREALRRLETLEDPPRFSLIGLHNNLGALLQDMRQNSEALLHYQRGVEIASRTLGPDHHACLTLAANLAAIERDSGDPERSAEILLDVVERRARSLGPAAEDTLTSRHAYWTSINHCERHDDAALGFAELADDVDTSLGREHPLWAQTEVSLARCLIDAGRHEEALPHALDAATRMSAYYGPGHQRTLGAQRIVEAARGARGR